MLEGRTVKADIVKVLLGEAGRIDGLDSSQVAKVALDSTRVVAAAKPGRDTLIAGPYVLAWRLRGPVAGVLSFRARAVTTAPAVGTVATFLLKIPTSSRRRMSTVRAASNAGPCNRTPRTRTRRHIGHVSCIPSTRAHRMGKVCRDSTRGISSAQPERLSACKARRGK